MICRICRGDIPDGIKFYMLCGAEHYKDLSKSSKDGYDRAYALSETLYKRKFRELRAKDFQAIIDASEGKSNSFFNGDCQ